MTVVRRYSQDLLTRTNQNEYILFSYEVCKSICTNKPGQCRKDCLKHVLEFSEDLQEPCAKMTCDCYHPNTKGKLEYAAHQIYRNEEYEEKERRAEERERAINRI